MSEVSALQKYSCPACGAEAVWNAKKQALICPYCGMESPVKLSDDNSLIKELDLIKALDEIPQDQRGWEAERISVQCQSCKAISLFSANQVANRCEFCGSPAVVPYMETRNPIHPESLLPFKVDESKVRDTIREWYRTRWFAPNRLKTKAFTDTVHGVYIPYWTFDAKVNADWIADSGTYYYTTETYRDGSGRMQTRQVRHVRWTPAAGSIQHFFDDELVPGTHGIAVRLLKKIEPFPTTTKLIPFDTGYVSGWVVEQYQIDLKAAAQYSQEAMEQEIRRLCIREIPGDTYRNLNVDAEYNHRTFKHILVPIWLLSYDYGRCKYQVIVNGFTGSMAGEYPKSWIKITLAVLALLIAVAMIFAMLNAQ